MRRHPVRHFLSIETTTPAELRRLLARAAHWKKRVRARKPPAKILRHKVLACLFEKPSTRTRVSFERAMDHLGGRAMYLSPPEVGLGRRESVKDVARVLGRYVDAICARVFAHASVVELAAHAGVPVVNGLSDREHPCQALGDLLTIAERVNLKRRPRVAFVGDGNNVANSLLLGCAALDLPFVWIGPDGFAPTGEILAAARAKGGKKWNPVLSNDVADVSGARFVYTDVWASMGQEAETANRRLRFRGYQVNDELLVRAGRSAEALHCLPAHRGEEITDSVMDGPRNASYEQAENRCYAQMAVLEALLA